MSNSAWTPIKNKCNPLYGLTYEDVLFKVKQDGYVLRHVQVQTPEICMAAVQQCGWALKYVQAQTLEICKAAVQQDDNVLQFVHDEFIHLFE